MKKQINIGLFILISGIFMYFIYDSIQHIHAEVLHRNGYIKKERGYPHYANQDFLKACSLMPWENHYRLQLAKSYEESAKKRPKKEKFYRNLAINEYKKLIKSDSINPWFQARLGLIYHGVYKKDKSDEKAKSLAFNYAKKATENDPKNPLFTLHFGHLLFSYGKYNEAKEYYTKTINYDNDITEAHFNIAAIYNKKNNNEKAIEHYKHVVNQIEKLEKRQRRKPKPENKVKIETFQNARIKLADYYLNKNEFKKAFEIIEKIPVSVERYELSAKYLGKINQKESAISIYKQLNDRLKTTSYDVQIKALSK